MCTYNLCLLCILHFYGYHINNDIARHTPPRTAYVAILLTLENPIFGVGAWCKEMSCRWNTASDNMKQTKEEKQKHIRNMANS